MSLSGGYASLNSSNSSTRSAGDCHSTCRKGNKQADSNDGNLNNSNNHCAHDSGGSKSQKHMHTLNNDSRKISIASRSVSAHIPPRVPEFSVDDTCEEANQDRALHYQQVKFAAELIRKRATGNRRRPAARIFSKSKQNTAVEEHNDNGCSTGVSFRESSRTNSTDENVGDGVGGGKDTNESISNVDCDVNDGDDDDDGDSFTLKDRQDAINEAHPFGIRIWKPALYKKKRSVQATAEGDIHSAPGGFVSNGVLFFNLVWTLLFGWILAAVVLLGWCGCLIIRIWDHNIGGNGGGAAYGNVLFGLAKYLFYPFGKYVKLVQEDAYAEEDEGLGRSLSDYEQWQSGSLEEGRLFFGPLNTTYSLTRTPRDCSDPMASQRLLSRTEGESMSEVNGNWRRKQRFFGRGKWNLGRVFFFAYFYGIISPLLLLVSFLCWLMVFSIPMGKVTFLLFNHLRRHPLALSFHSDTSGTGQLGERNSTIIVCTYRAAGLKYWKYTVDGTNIILINFLGLVVFIIVDYYILHKTLRLDLFISHHTPMFFLSLSSTIPLAIFIGQAVASISAQSSMGVGATINAFFSTVVEVYLYCIALKEGRSRLVEGSIIGSLFAGILFLPGVSMCFGALRRKTQRFNVKSAGVTSTMLLFAVLGAFGPTLFYQIYGNHELTCQDCGAPEMKKDNECKRCHFSQVPAVDDKFFNEAVKPYIRLCAIFLFLSYIIGLMFTLRTHAASIWNVDHDEKKGHEGDLQQNHHHHHHHYGSGPGHGGHVAEGSGIGMSGDDIRKTKLYQHVLHTLFCDTDVGKGVERERGRDSGISDCEGDDINGLDKDKGHGRSGGRIDIRRSLDRYSEENQVLIQNMVELAAAAVAVAAQDASRSLGKTAQSENGGALWQQSDWNRDRIGYCEATENGQGSSGVDMGEGDISAMHNKHDAPNWSRKKSALILLSATISYAVIAEILVNTVSAVLSVSNLSEKFLGLTLFALVPNATEFLNAILFAMNGNIALSMEIGSAYALQVCLLQIPALVLYSTIMERFTEPWRLTEHSFMSIFPQWDMITVIFCVFLLSYMYGEGKSNYFKGSILLCSYSVIIIGFYFSSYGTGENVSTGR